VDFAAAVPRVTQSWKLLSPSATGCASLRYRLLVLYSLSLSLSAHIDLTEYIVYINTGKYALTVPGRSVTST
jgi:hypothetical protein